MPEIEQLTLWEVNDLMAYWQDYPPTHVLVAAYLLGAGKGSRRTGKGSGKLDELSHAVSIAGGSTKGKLPNIYRGLQQSE